MDQPQEIDMTREDPIVTSGESDEGVLEDSDEEDGGQLLRFGQETRAGSADILYDANADEEDEAYVYEYLRSGSAEPASKGSNSNAALLSEKPAGGPSQKKKKIVKPRNSDAVLSCPCCLSIVCMDCQQHERYKNQYRAMFVMNIMVLWNVRLKYDTDQSQLVPYEDQPCSSVPVVQEESDNQQQSRLPRVVEDHPEECKAATNNEEDDPVYYKVCCANCHTPVASLDMSDEVYHFYGCVASA